MACWLARNLRIGIHLRQLPLCDNQHSSNPGPQGTAYRGRGFGVATFGFPESTSGSLPDRRHSRRGRKGPFGRSRHRWMLRAFWGMLHDSASEIDAGDLREPYRTRSGDAASPETWKRNLLEGSLRRTTAAPSPA